MQCHTKLNNVVHQGKKIIACFVRSVETSPVCQTNINPSSLTWNEKICVVNKNKEIKSPNASLVECTWFHVQSLSCLQSFVWWSGHCIFRKKSLVCEQIVAKWGQSWLLGYQDGVEIYEGWTLKVIKVYFPFCWELFFLMHWNLLRCVKCHFQCQQEQRFCFYYSINRTKWTC